MLNRKKPDRLKKSGAPLEAADGSGLGTGSATLADSGRNRQGDGIFFQWGCFNVRTREENWHGIGAGTFRLSQVLLSHCDGSTEQCHK
ncbi:MAG TPA: hypothetical protein VM009_03640 [Terriglobales bacterium]|nr:hypothetical protein [Terriglobales bacterium]